MPPRISKPLQAKFRQVRLLLCDVDGILTDATIWLNGISETKRFNLTDGLGLRLLRNSGIQVGWISGRCSAATEQRGKELEIDFLYQGQTCKLRTAEEILAKTGLPWTSVCFMGDDLVDLSLLSRAGVAVTVPHAMAEAKALADYVTRAPGGHGAVREVIELILNAQNKWKPLVADYTAGRL
jgi:3-deoxy-D-manno-octulosonate 8-phosphate phosphatase (KDO 8-P phosphatase)